MLYTKLVKLKHFFLPHPDTHQKAHLISAPALLIYVLFFMFLQVNRDNIRHFKPGVLGIASNIDTKSLIQLTNIEREKNGLSSVTENTELDQAAAAKGQNMLAENYWAHFAPSGKSPWDFIQAAGYKFSYAGENLARNFYNSPDVVAAWMASPSHRENILNSHYVDIGMAVVQGTLQGEQTTLVVQEFGTPINYVASNPTPVTPPAQVASVPKAVVPVVKLPVSEVAGQSSKPTLIVDPYAVEKDLGLGVLFMIMVLTVLDLTVIKRRGVGRLAYQHLPHLALLLVAVSALVIINPGGIL